MLQHALNRISNRKLSGNLEYQGPHFGEQYSNNNCQLFCTLTCLCNSCGFLFHLKHLSELVKTIAMRATDIIVHVF